MGTPNSLSTKYGALVSKRREMAHPDTVIFTHGSLLQTTVVVGSREPGQPQLSMARLRRLVWELSGSDVSIPLRA